MSMIALTTSAVKPFKAVMPSRVQGRRPLSVRMQGAHAAAPPASGDIKDKNAELAINGTWIGAFWPRRARRITCGAESHVTSYPFARVASAVDSASRGPD